MIVALLVTALRDGALAAGAVAGALVAIAAAVRLPVVHRPVRWLWRRLVGEPATAWHHRSLESSPLGQQLRATVDRVEVIGQQVTAIDRQVHPNGGGSLLDIARTNSERIGRIEGTGETVAAQLDTIDSRLANGEARFRTVDHRLDALEGDGGG